MRLWKFTFRKTEDDNGVTVVTERTRSYPESFLWAAGMAAAYASERGLEIISVVSEDDMGAMDGE